VVSLERELTDPSTNVDSWPALRVDDWTDTRDTLHMWTQVVGKIRLAQAPMVNHWWQVPLYVSARGLTTSAIPYGRRIFDMEFDFRDHQLRIRASSGDERAVALEPKPVSRFYAQTMAALQDFGLDGTIRTTPTEVERAIPFEQDHEHGLLRPRVRAAILAAAGAGAPGAG
jgi:hypothetical protein